VSSFKVDGVRPLLVAAGAMTLVHVVLRAVGL